MKIALAQINPIVGDLVYNRKKITEKIAEAKAKSADLVVFTEMALCGYPPEDLLLLPSFIAAIENELKEIIPATKGIIAVIGCVRANPYGGEKALYNSAALIQNGELIGFQDKTLLPDYDVFSERRYFEPASRTDCWSLNGKKVAITICEDIWQHAGAVEYSTYMRDPVLELKKQAPDFLINLSASPYYLRRLQTRFNVCIASAKTLNCPVLFCNQVGANDSLIFDGYSMAFDPSGKLIAKAKGFEEDLLLVDLEQESSASVAMDAEEDLYHALVLGIRDYFQKLGFSKACLGLSGGIDSALVACLAVEALGKENVLAIGLPSRYSTLESLSDAILLCENLGIVFKAVSIEKPFETFLDLLSPHFGDLPTNTTEENLQARIRGMILMAFSNKFGFLILSTGNKSEMAMGYTTLYGDMCGGLAVLSDVSKDNIYKLSRWINREKEIIPESILEKAPSAELKPNQKDSDTLPEYPIVDLVLKDYVEEHKSPEEIAKIHKLPLSLVKDLVWKIHNNEYKRRQAPPGLRVTKKSFTMGRRFPIVQRWNAVDEK